MNHSFFKIWESLGPDRMTQVEIIDQARYVYSRSSSAQTKSAALRIQTRAHIRHDRDMRIKHRARELKRTFEERRQKSDWAMSFGPVTVRWPFAIVRTNGI